MSPRRMKEASVAGEPDKSEQRKSSGTAEERDPRFAVFREPAAAADSASAGGGRTGAATDTATAVFRAPHPAGADSDAQASRTGRVALAENARDDAEDGAEVRAGGSGSPAEGGTRGDASEGPGGASEASGGASGAAEAGKDVSG
ncbi:D-alanyl-D-alanine carboxypeptidase, partial [Streptomyces sp. NPDC005899]